MYRAAPAVPEDTRKEWVEILNAGPTPVDLAGWRLAGGVDFAFPPQSVPPGDLVVVAADPALFLATYSNFTGTVLGPWTGVLGNNGNTIRLIAASGEVEDSVAYASQGNWAVRVRGPLDVDTAGSPHYGWEWFAEHDGLGKSLELRNPALPNEHGQNWAASGPEGGTPGAPNSVLTNNVAPLVVNARHFPAVPTSTNEILFSAEIIDEAASGLTVTLFHRVDAASPPPFSATPMFDDGAHGDGLPGDGVFGAVLPPFSNHTVIEFYIEAVDATGLTNSFPAPARQLDGVTFDHTCNLLLQVDDTPYTGPQQMIKLIMTSAETNELQRIHDNSTLERPNSKMNATFISLDPAGPEVIYTASVRNRGHGSRTQNPMSLWVGFPNEQTWNGVRSINLNSQYTPSQVFGAAIFQKAGLPMADARPVRLRVNNRDLARAGSSQWGFYSLNEHLSAEFANRHFPLDPEGNCYRGIRIGSEARLEYLGENKNSYTNRYFKQNNAAADDWSDLIDLCRTCSLSETNPAYVSEMRRVADVEEWMVYFAANTIADNNETALSNGTGDDYAMYRGVRDPRFRLMAYDVDSLFGWQGSSATASLFRMTNNLANIRRFILHPEFTPLYYATLKRLLETTFSATEFNALADQILGGWLDTAQLTQRKDWMAQRRAYILARIPLSLTVTTHLARVDGYYQTTEPSAPLWGSANVIETRAVLVNGQPALWNHVSGVWTNPAVPLRPGINRVLVQAIDSNNVEIARATLDLWFNNGFVVNVGGAITSDTTWRAADGPFRVTSSITVGNGVTLTIEPGTTVFFASDTGINVTGTGRLLAEGTDTQRIRFTRVPASTGAWAGLSFNNTSAESRVTHADFEFAGSSGQNLEANNAVIFVAHCTFTNTSAQYADLRNSSFIIRGCTFPDNSGVEFIHGVDIPPGGYAIIESNLFGSPLTGLNDVIDFSGGQRPNAILQILNNVFTGASDDHLDLDGTDALIEGNVFLRAHKNNPNPGDTASAISGGVDRGFTSRLTIVRNLFFDCDHVALCKEGNFYTFVNNTVLHATLGGINFGEPERGVTGGAGAYLDGNIFWDVPRLFLNYTAAVMQVTVNRCLLPVAWPGAGNVVADPRLQNTNLATITAATIREDVRLRSGSPAQGTGPNGLDMGALVPPGASLAGEPPALTPLTSATLTVGGPGIIAYRWSLNDGPYSAELSISNNQIVLTGLTNGTYTVRVLGKNDAGVWQAEPTVSKPWTVNTALARLVINEVLARNVAAFAHHGTYPDAIELHNAGAVPMNLAGYGLTDDARQPFKYIFPPGTSMAPGQHLVLLADNERLLPGIHLGFALSQTGDEVLLFDPATNRVDSVEFGPQLADFSIGRRGDGSWGLCVPTLGAANLAAPVGNERGVKLNEWFARGEAVFFQDFVEVYNPDTLPVNLGGFYFSDAPAGSPTRSPVRPLTFVPARGFLVFLADGDGAAGPNHLDFRLLRFVGQLGLFAPDLALVDSVAYLQQAVDVSEGRLPDGALTIGPIRPPTPGAPNPTGGPITVISNIVVDVLGLTNHLWRYEASATPLDVNWPAPGYDDSAWPEGRGLFGYETTPAVYPFPFATPIPAPSQGGPNTVYYRTHFQVPALEPGVALYATNYLDDGAVFYLNGQEADRLRLPAGAINYNTSANNQPSEGQPEIRALPLTNLVVGDNVIAVEVHQAGVGSSDDVFGLALALVKSFTNILQPEGLKLNEVMANNVSTTNTDGSVTDYVEIVNPTDRTIDLTGFSLSDDLSNPRRWVFPPGVTLAPGEFLVVKCDPNAPPSSNNVPPLNTGFGLKAGGDKVYLFDSPANSGAQIDALAFGLQAPDFSLGRQPDGIGAWRLNLPTPGRANSPATLGDPTLVRLNEWMANPRNGDDWFELFNPNPQPVELSGCYLTDNLNNRTQYRIPALSFMGYGGKGFAVFIADNRPTNGADHVNFRLNNDGEALGLYSPAGIEIDSLRFGRQAQDVSEGRLPDGAPTRAFFSTTVSPGDANWLPLTQVVINEALTHSDPPLEDAIELFNPTDEAVAIGGWWLSDARDDPRRFRIPPGAVLPARSHVVFYEFQFNPPPPDVPPSFALSGANGDEIHLSQVDVNGTLTGYRAAVRFGPAPSGVSFGRYETSVGGDFVLLSNRTFGADSPATVEQFRAGTGLPNAAPIVGPIVINEIHYHPPDLGPDDNVADEFIELHNLTDAAQPLFDPANPANTWHLRDGVTFDFPPGFVIPPRGYVLVVSFDPVADPVSLTAFTTKYHLTNVTILGPYQGRLANDGESLELRRPDVPNPDDTPYVLVEDIRYSDRAPWASAADGHPVGVGLSLQRVVAGAFGNEPTNWVAALPTPAAPNGPAMDAPPTITVQPVGGTVLAGSFVTLSVAADGAPALAYQWRYYDTDIPGATGASHVIAGIQPTNAGRYSVRVSNPYGAAWSAPAELVVREAPVILAQPESRMTLLGLDVTFSVVARGTPPLGYQWFHDSAPLAGAVNPTLTLPNVGFADQGGYVVVLSNAYGVVTSEVATLTVNSPPIIDVPPPDQIVYQGQTVTFTVAVRGSEPLRFQWLFNGAPLGGQTNATLVLGNVQLDQAGEYSVWVSNNVGSAASAPARLTVVPLPVITVLVPAPTAHETGPVPGRFRLVRAGPTNLSVTVTFSLGGTAGPADYALDPPGVSAVIPAGATSVDLMVRPTDDTLIEYPETVVLTLAPGADYLIGSPASATVTIVDDDNRTPTVALTGPPDGTFFPITPTNILLAATAHDPDGSVVRVDFYNHGTNYLGSDPAPPYEFLWVNAPSGTNRVTAVAHDNLSASAASAPVAVIVNAAPSVFLVTPANGASFFAPANIPLLASASDPDGTVTEVEFFVNGVRFATSTNPPYTVTYPDALIGTYQFSATAWDNYGQSASADPVTVSVVEAVGTFADLFAERGVIGSYSNYVTGSNAGASLEPGEPRITEWDGGGRSVWISWIAPAPGIVTVDLLGSSFDTLLAVYTNKPGMPVALTNLVKVAENDDYSFFLQSRVEFTNGAPGTTYFITADGYGGAAGNLIMHLSLASALPFITQAPLSQTNNQGASVTFTVGVGGTGPFAYQWRFNAAPLANATNSSLTLLNLQASHAGSYDVVVANAAGAVTSSVATLTVRTPPSILSQPQDLYVPFNGMAIFSVLAGGWQPAYQWRFNGVPIPGATNASYVRYAVQASDLGDYTVVVSNLLGMVTSRVATLSFAVPAVLVSPAVAHEAFTLRLQGGVTNRAYAIEVSSNLVNWAEIATVTNRTGQTPFEDAGAARAPQRFYRARLAP